MHFSYTVSTFRSGVEEFASMFLRSRDGEGDKYKVGPDLHVDFPS
jgi:hypothetical protein